MPIPVLSSAFLVGIVESTGTSESKLPPLEVRYLGPVGLLEHLPSVPSDVCLDVDSQEGTVTSEKKDGPPPCRVEEGRAKPRCAEVTDKDGD